MDSKYLNRIKTKFPLNLVYPKNKGYIHTKAKSRRDDEQEPRLFQGLQKGSRATLWLNIEDFAKGKDILP
jgi:hypothetical protein